jgi:F-type H+-transporting ATPase subunit alpha
MLWAVQNGYFDRVEVTRVKDYQQRLTEYLTSAAPQLLERLAAGPSLDDTLTTNLRTACDAFTRLWK